MNSPNMSLANSYLSRLIKRPVKIMLELSPVDNKVYLIIRVRDKELKVVTESTEATKVISLAYKTIREELPYLRI